MQSGAVGNFLQAARDFVLPLSCAVCGASVPSHENGIICGPCWTRVRTLPSPQCHRCGHPIGKYDCRWCDNLPPFVRAARSWCWMGAGTGEEIVYALKYEGWQRAGDAIAERMARLQFPLDVVEERRAIIPVPLTSARQRERGYNQSAVIARSLAPRWRIPVWEDVLVRTSGTTSQTRLTPAERKGNVAGAFAVPGTAGEKIGGAHLLLLDDVVTTGSTLRAAATALFASGARTISITTFGRAPASGDRLFP